MALWHTHGRPRTKETGKFRRQAATGISRSAAGQHLGWHYDIIAHQIGASLRRTSYNATISDSSNNRVAYLRGFASSDLATAAAKKLIANAHRRRLTVGCAGNIGTVPSMPMRHEK